MKLRLALSIALWSLCACTETTEPEPDAGTDVDVSADAWIAIGTGDRPTRFEPVADGSVLDMIWGIQGGYHIWAGFEGEGFAPRNANFRYSLWDGTRRVGGADFVDDVFVDGTRLYYAGVTVFIYNDVSVDDLDGRALVMRLELEDETGFVVSAELNLVANCCSGDPTFVSDAGSDAGGDAGSDAGSDAGGDAGASDTPERSDSDER